MIDQKNQPLYLPIELAELLHATLGPLSEVLERENHHWAEVVRRVLAEYVAGRNQILTHIHGDKVMLEVAHETFVAAEKVCLISDLAISEEEDFIRWREEVDGGIS